MVSTIIIVIVLLMIAGWAYNKYQNLAVDFKIAEQNQAALNDSLRISKEKIKGLVYSKQVLVARNESDLKKLNEDMAKTVKKLKGKIHELTKLVGEIRADTVYIDTTTVVSIPDSISKDHNVKAFKWDYEKSFDVDNYRAIAGQTTFKVDSLTGKLQPIRTSITKDIIRFQLTQGLRTTEDGKVEMFATSTYPNFAVKELNSVIISPSTHPALKQFSKKKKFGFSLYAGYGGTLNLSNSTMIFGPQIGFGGTYQLFQF